jgi:hypothetical protein
MVEPACSQVGRTAQKTANSLAALCFLFAIAFTPFASSAEERFAAFFFAVALAIGSYMGGYILRRILELSGKLCETIRIRCVRLLASLANEVLGRRVQTLEKCFVEQSRLLKHLRGELEIALSAEADLRKAIIEIDGHANAATQNLSAEKVQLQAALDRANGERARLAHELADPKRRQAEEPGRASGSTIRRRHTADRREEQIHDKVVATASVP